MLSPDSQNETLVITSEEDAPKPQERLGIMASINEAQKEIREALGKAGMTARDALIVGLYLVDGMLRKDPDIKK